MGRELRRVPVDFDWPLNKVWVGFVNPHHRPCPRVAEGDCHGGATSAALWLDGVARMIAMLGDHVDEAPHAEALRARRVLWPHPYLVASAFSPTVRYPSDLEPHDLGAYRREHPPWSRVLPFTEELGQLVDGLGGAERRGLLGREAYPIVKVIKGAAGIDPRGSWGTCEVCRGSGLDPAVEAAYDAWEVEPPPVGDGWQLWTTTNEGAPISDVYPTREAFVEYLVREGYSRVAAERFCDVGWTSTGMITPDGDVLMDVEMLGDEGTSP